MTARLDAADGNAVLVMDADLQDPPEVVLHLFYRLFSWMSEVKVPLDAGLSFLFSKLLGLYSVPGLASIAVFVAFLGGMQLLLLGIVGEYIARIHDEVKGRPLYLVRDAHGVTNPS